MLSRLLTPWIIFAVSLAIAAAGFYALMAEASPFLKAGRSAATRFQAIVADELSPGLSSGSARLVLDECYSATTSIYGKAQPSARRQALQSNCAELSSRIAAWAPSNSYAWFMRAFAAVEQEDWDIFNDAMRHARTTAPNEQWLAALRAEFAAANLQHLDRSNADGFHADLALLVYSDEGIASVARLYDEMPSLRERIAAVVERLSEEDQRRFLRAIRARVPGT